MADVLFEVWLQKPGAITAAAIIVRFGIDRLCSGQQFTDLE